MKAFPGRSKVTIVESPSGNETETLSLNEGMDLRDYFAAKAMQSFISLDPTDSKQLSRPNKRQYRQWIAEDSYAMADQMMEARNEKANN